MFISPEIRQSRRNAYQVAALKKECPPPKAAPKFQRNLRFGMTCYVGKHYGEKVEVIYQTARGYFEAMAAKGLFAQPTEQELNQYLGGAV